jgi:ribosomal protein S18 acetylase RimI-like enzyme
LSTAEVDPALIAMFDRQMVELYTAARIRPWADIKLDDDVAWGRTGIPLPVFNGASGATFTEATADARIDTILDYFRELRVDMTWWVGPTSTPADLGDRLVAHGLEADETIPGMAMRLDAWVPPAVPDGIEIVPATDAAEFHEAMDVMFEGFEIPRHAQPAFEERFADFCIGPRAIQTTYIARIAGRAVSTSLGMLVDGVVGIYNVATAADARRRGAGGAVTAAAMADGQARGARWALLESSEMGRSVYERLGFRQVCEITVYAGHFSGSTPEARPD